MKIRADIEGARVVVALTGRFDAHEAAEFRAAVHPLLSADARNVRVNLSQVAFVDSTALAELVRLQKSARALGGEVVLEQLSDPVRVILEITDLDQMFTIASAEPA